MTKALMHRSPGDISVIKFDGARVRIVKINGEPWFIAADVCAALEISNITDAVSALDSDEVMTLALTEGHSGKRGGARRWNVVAESGFYKLISRSRKASTPGTFAHRFSNWIFRDVIPTIRKTGAYGVPFVLLNEALKSASGYSCSLGFLRWRKSTSLLRAAVINCPVLSPGSFTFSTAFITSWGTLAATVCDFAFTALVAMSVSPLTNKTQYALKKNSVQHLTCLTPAFKLVLNTFFIKGRNSETRQCWSTNRASDHHR